MDAPEIIYLQAWMPEVTWCEDKINDDDIEYIRADRVIQIRDALEKATGRIATLPPDSMGITYTDEKQMLYIRNELLKEMGQVLADSGGMEE